MGNDIKPDNQPVNEGNNNRNAEFTAKLASVISDARRDQTGSIGELGKPKRGRPKGSKNKPHTGGVGSDYREDYSEVATSAVGEQSTSTGEQSETPIFVQSQKGKRRGRKPIAKTIENPAEVSEKVIDTIELAAIRFIGEEARLEPFERFLIEIGATDTMSKVSPETAAKVASIVSPICLIGGLALYGFRMASVVSQKMQQEKQVEIKQTDSTFAHEGIDSEIAKPSQNGFDMKETIIPPMSKLNDLTIDKDAFMRS